MTIERGLQKWHERAKKMRLDGFSAREIAEALGKSPAQVRHVTLGIGPSLKRVKDPQMPEMDKQYGIQIPRLLEPVDDPQDPVTEVLTAVRAVAR